MEQKIIRGMPGVCKIIDRGPTKAIHEKRLQKILTHCKENNLELHKAKYRIGKEKVKFVGHVISAAGIEMSSEKTGESKLPLFEGQAGVKELLGPFELCGESISASACHDDRTALRAHESQRGVQVG